MPIIDIQGTAPTSASTPPPPSLPPPVRLPPPSARRAPPPSVRQYAAPSLRQGAAPSLPPSAVCLPPPSASAPPPPPLPPSLRPRKGTRSPSSSRAPALPPPPTGILWATATATARRAPPPSVRQYAAPSLCQGAAPSLCQYAVRLPPPSTSAPPPPSLPPTVCRQSFCRHGVAGVERYSSSPVSWQPEAEAAAALPASSCMCGAEGKYSSGGYCCSAVCVSLLATGPARPSLPPPHSLPPPDSATSRERRAVTEWALAQCCGLPSPPVNMPLLSPLRAVAASL
ncbi:formin-like protein 14 [Phragmites australis]|uniref:formin-like protein 14 n=1 Tax=Phragmites australis TaxID=29695 RepID=UPI002D77AEA5|nr:formin-like protein 14 [Phragmites australis]